MRQRLFSALTLPRISYPLGTDPANSPGGKADCLGWSCSFPALDSTTACHGGEAVCASF
jgi:hypothetical protein